MKYGIAIAGAHGKTTTTSLVATILAAAELDPTAVIGGRLDAFGSNARLGQGEFLVAEADESDGSFLALTPTWAVITTIDREHLDFWPDFERIRDAFVDVREQGALLRGGVPRRRRPGGARRSSRGSAGARSPTASAVEADVRGIGRRRTRGRSRRASCTRAGASSAGCACRSPGAHNLVERARRGRRRRWSWTWRRETIFGALATFRNAHRRFEVRGERGGVLVVDDYGHHPTEIRATLAAARRGYGRRIVVAFQPHRYTRTRDLEAEFLGAFDDADLVFATEIYAASEEPIPGVSGERLAGLHRRARAARGALRPRQGGPPRRARGARCAPGTSCSRSAPATSGRPATACSRSWRGDDGDVDAESARAPLRGRGARAPARRRAAARPHLVPRRRAGRPALLPGRPRGPARRAAPGRGARPAGDGDGPRDEPARARRRRPRARRQPRRPERHRGRRGAAAGRAGDAGRPLGARPAPRSRRSSTSRSGPGSPGWSGRRGSRGASAARSR